MIIETPRLILSDWRDKDAPAFARINADPKVMRYFPSTLTRAESDATLAKAKQQTRKHGFSYWAAELKSSHKCIGFIGLQRYQKGFPFAPCVDIGWRLCRTVWGQGLATEGALAALAYGFNHLNLAEIVAMTSIHNRASERVMQKIGMKRQRDTFLHPALDPEHELAEHCLYKIQPHEMLLTGQSNKSS